MRVIIVHGLWTVDQFLALWLEDGSAECSLPRPRGRAPRIPRARSHPFTLPGSEVACVLAGLDEELGDAVAKGVAGEVELLLPGYAHGPLPSPGAIRRETPQTVIAARPGEQVGLWPWLVPVLSLEPGEAVRALGVFAGLDLESGHRLDAQTPRAEYRGELFRCASSLRWLVALAGHAGALAGAGAVLPGLVDRDGEPLAVWRPAPGDGHRDRVRALAASAPAVCRAERVGDSLCGREPAQVTSQALDALVDAEVRQRLSNRPGEALVPARRGRRPAVFPAGEAFLAALTGEAGWLPAVDPGEVATLRDRLLAWWRSGVERSGPLRVCFRLVEPEGDEAVGSSAGSGAPGGVWRLEFLLQATDEPSLLVTVDQVWKTRGRLTVFERGLDDPQEAFLAALGRASRFYPPLEGALRTRRPAGLDLDETGVHAFLTEGAPLLAGSGYGVLLPSWWQKRTAARLGLKLSASSRTSAPGAVATASSIGMNALQDFRWEVALGEQTLTEDELGALAAAKAPLVRVRGQWMEVDAERIAAAARFLRERGSGEMTAGEVLRTALAPDAIEAGLPVSAVTASGWLGDLLGGQAEQRLEPVATPDVFAATLRPYQERGLSWLVFLSRLGLGGVLADDMGLGKTVQTLALLAVEQGERAELARQGVDVPPAPTLLVCPMSLVGNWQREAAKFAPMLTVHVHHGAERLAGDELVAAIGGADLVLTTYALAQRDAEALRAVAWWRIVVDEAQAIKNRAAKQSQVIRALPAAHRLALTGTPVENRLSELHAILDFTNPGLFGSAAAFRRAYSVPIERDGDEAAKAALKRRVQPFTLRRLKTDPAIIRDLPEKFEMKAVCNLTAEQASLYEAVVADMMDRIATSEGIERRGLVLATLAKLKQVCNHPAQLLRDGTRLSGRSGKLARLEEILEEVIAEGDKALCFTQFAEFGSMLQVYLADRLGREVLFLHGGVPKKRRDDMVARFQESDAAPVFLLSLKAGGTGLNLTAANHVIHVDRWWNPAVEDQATDRAFRIGQRRDVQVRKFVCAGTVEERIEEMIEAKRALAQAVVGSGENWLTELSTEQLRDLVALSADAVSE